MKTMRSFKIRSIIISLVYLLMGIVLLIFPDKVAELIAYVFAALIFLLGIFFVVCYMKEDAFAISPRRNLMWGLILIIASVFCMLNINFLIGIIPQLMGLMVVINGLGKLQDSFDLYRTHNPGGTVILIFSIIVTAFGVLLLINPFGAVKLFYILVGIAMIVSGVTDIITVVVISRALKNAVQDATAIDAPEEDGFPE